MAQEFAENLERFKAQARTIELQATEMAFHWKQPKLATEMVQAYLDAMDTVMTEYLRGKEGEVINKEAPIVSRNLSLPYEKCDDDLKETKNNNEIVIKCPKTGVWTWLPASKGNCAKEGEEENRHGHVLDRNVLSPDEKRDDDAQEKPRAMVEQEAIQSHGSSPSKDDPKEALKAFLANHGYPEIDIANADDAALEERSDFLLSICANKDLTKQYGLSFILEALVYDKAIRKEMDARTHGGQYKTFPSSVSSDTAASEDNDSSEAIVVTIADFLSTIVDIDKQPQDIIERICKIKSPQDYVDFARNHPECVNESLFPYKGMTVDNLVDFCRKHGFFHCSEMDVERVVSKLVKFVKKKRAEKDERAEVLEE